MRWIPLLGLWLMGLWLPASAVPDVRSVAVLYNSSIEESKKLAEFYIKQREIPEANLIGLDMPKAQTISRDQYNESILEPLKKEFSKRGWWKRGVDAQGVVLPTENRIRVLVTVRGVPLKISQTPKPEKNGETEKKHPFKGRDEASVDSELSMFGAEGLPVEGGLKNAYFKSDQAIEKASLPFLVLTARIDAPTYQTCERMIRDALEVEKTGLWGMAYVDIANKFKMGDDWLEEVVKANLMVGIPTVVDRFSDTLPSHYPMQDAALYYGWYDWNLSGPFMNPNFHFRKGAVAMHLHSYSAQQLRDPNKNWSGGLLEKGAAVTVGNVHEPYLHMTHHFGLLHQRLLAGHSWVEACWMAMPVVSWQGVVLGDPLYQPFRHLRGTGKITERDRDYRALRAAALKWKDDAEERRSQLEKAALRLSSATIFEALGLEFLELGKQDQAKLRFKKAGALCRDAADRLRQELHAIAIDRSAKRKPDAVTALKAAKKNYSDLNEVKSVQGWLDILDPPPPPPADPRQAPESGIGASPKQ